MAQPKFLSLEIGRGVAAILVLLFHIDKFYFDSSQYWPSKLFGGLFTFGHAGVQFFFVLSGFVMIWSHYKDLGRPEQVWPFIYKRIIRIYPLVIVTTAALAALYFALPSAGRPEYRDPLVILQSLLLVGREPIDALNFPSWTLWHENLFYVACVAIIARPRWGLAALVVWTVASIVPSFFISNSLEIAYPLREVNALFILGVGIAFFLKNRTLPAAGLITVGGIVGFFAFGICSALVVEMQPIENLVYGVTSAMVIAGAIELERSGGLVLPGATALLGTLSFPLYLTHMITLPIFAKLIARLGLNHLLPGPVGLALAVSAALAVAFITHYAFERPVYRLLREKIAPRRNTAASTA